MNAIVTEKVHTRNKIHPQKFALWAACASIMMMFGAFTSAYIVRQAAGNWLEFVLPAQFFFSALVILLSSLTIHSALSSFKKGHERTYKIMLLLSFVLGVTFLILQYAGWQALDQGGIRVNGNPSGSFVYVISWLHAAHVLGGIGALTVALLHGFSLPFKPTDQRKLRLELTATYWHFVDILWIYLLVFFTLQSSF